MQSGDCVAEDQSPACSSRPFPSGPSCISKLLTVRYDIVVIFTPAAGEPSGLGELIKIEVDRNQMTVTTPSSSDVSEAGLFRLSQTEVRVGLSVLLLSLVARWQALSPGYSIDDFVQVLDDKPLSFGLLAAQGRALTYFLRLALGALGASPANSEPLSMMLLTLALVAAGLIVCRLWGIHGFAESLIVVSFIALHPYQSEMFTFKAAALYLAIPLGCSFAAILASTRSARCWIWSLVALVCSLCIYQAVLNYLAMALMFSVAFHLSRPAGSNPTFWPRLRSQLKLILGAVILYFVTAYAVSRISGVPLGTRTVFIGLNEIGSRINQAYELYKVLFFRPEPILPSGTKALLLLTLAFALGAYLVKALRRGAYSAVRRVALAFALILVAGLPLCVGVILVLGDWWPAPRVLAQTGMFWGGSLTLAYSLAQPLVRRIMLTSVVVIILSFIGISNHVFKDQLRVNMRDLATANRMVGRIEALPDFAQVQYVVLYGGSYRYCSPITTAQRDMNISALFAPWSKLPVINEVSGYAFQPVPGGIFVKANAFCETAPKWPATGSVVKLDTVAVVCREK